MAPILRFLKTTLLGGLVFLVPVVLVGMVLRHAMEIAGKIARPAVSMFPAHEIAGIAVGTIVAALFLLLVAFVAGLLAQTDPGRRLTRWVESSFLGSMPQYRVVTSMAEGLAKIEGSESLRPVLVEVDGGWQLAYCIEEVQGGWLAVFVPQSPTPLSGNVMYLPAARVRPLDIGIHRAMALVKHLGAGSGEELKGVDLTPARSD